MENLAKSHLVPLTNGVSRGVNPKARRGGEVSAPIPTGDLAEARIAQARAERANRLLDPDYGARMATGQNLLCEINPEDEGWYALFESDLGKRQPKPRQRTIDHYMGAIHQFLAFTWEYGMPMCTKLTRHEVEHWIDILDHGDPEHDPPIQAVKPNTVLNRYKGARIFFNWLVDDKNALGTNPFDLPKLKRPKGEQVTKAVASLEQLQALRHSLEHPKTANGKKAPANWRDGAITGILYDTGMRVSELANMLDENVNRQTRRIWIPGTDEGTKSRKPREVRVTPETMFFYRQYREQCERYMEAEDRPFAFEGISARTIRVAVKQAWKTLGITNLGPHSFRHSFATHALENRGENRMSETELRIYMGWESYGQIITYTRNLAPSMAARAAEEANVGYGQIQDRQRRRRRRRTPKAGDTD